MKVSMFMGSTYFYVEVCTTVFWHFFVWNFLRILIHFTLAIPLVTPPWTPISPTSHLPNISWCPVFNYMYTLGYVRIWGETERKNEIEREDVGKKIVISGQVMRRGVEATRKGKRQAKERHWRGGTIYRGGTDQIMGKLFRVGMDGIVQRRG